MFPRPAGSTRSYTLFPYTTLCRAARNRDFAYPDLLPLQRDNLQRATLRTTAYQALETLHLWTQRHARNLELIRTHDGSELFDAALAAGRGVIVAAPHYEIGRAHV